MMSTHSVHKIFLWVPLLHGTGFMVSQYLGLIWHNDRVQNEGTL